MVDGDPRELRILLVPGGGGSGPEHWHRSWARQDPRCSWVQQVDPTGGTRRSWVNRLDLILRTSDRPTVLVAHSLGCIVAAHWALSSIDAPGPVVAAMLVAPADVEEAPGLEGAPYREFVPIPLERLPFPSVVVASSNDPLLSIARADALASAWGSEIEHIGPHLHVGSDADLGDWSEGRTILERLVGPVAELPTGPQLEYDALDLDDDPTALPLDQAPLTGPFGAAPFVATPLGAAQDPTADPALAPPPTTETGPDETALAPPPTTETGPTETGPNKPPDEPLTWS